MAANNKSKYYVGVDLGGTKILAGVYDQDLKLLGKMKLSTKPERSYEEVMDRIRRCVREAVDECDLKLKQIQSLGIGVPGAVDPGAGRMIFAPNLDWRDKPVREDLKKALDLPVTVENDCNACAIGVHELELDGKPNSLMGIFIGTGIGGGIMIDGKIYSGRNRTAGEIGHTVLDLDGPQTKWGPKGTFESLVARPSLFGQIRDSVAAGEKTTITDLENLRSGELRKAIKRGDKLVERVVLEAARCTGIVVGNIINFLNPEVIALGGGVIEALGKIMLPVVQEVAVEHALPGTADGIRIVESKLGDHAGIAGAAVIARRLKS
ncbi:MAG: ROK family protein [Limisphaerales bacterium]